MDPLKYIKVAADCLTTKKAASKKIIIDEDEHAAQNMVAKTGQMGVPVIEIMYLDRKPEFVVGFNQPQLAYILEVQ